MQSLRLDSNHTWFNACLGSTVISSSTSTTVVTSTTLTSSIQTTKTSTTIGKGKF